ncbi:MULTISPECIES: ATP-binding protein [Streptomyces]|uniref:ATP-binding protein n=1 Tax=Streptomyces TaxID=1883 RepID=UPI001E4F16B6|nr:MULTISPECIES: ATP-binding protein [Streptomyces]UFQ19795.1 ATP-binding protein [Streptomyces huasconensis]WCL89417.1 ATP-binding protein [Streptomyces sp. JCM 35825]
MPAQPMRLNDGPPGPAVFDKEPGAVTDARDLTRGFLAGLSPAVSEQTAASIELVVSELVTNVVRHARGTLCSLGLQALPDAIAVTVSDADPRPPQERTPDLAGGTGGFGWPMVRNLAAAVSVTLGATGKTIRAELAR